MLGHRAATAGGQRLELRRTEAIRVRTEVALRHGNVGVAELIAHGDEVAAGGIKKAPCAGMAKAMKVQLGGRGDTRSLPRLSEILIEPGERERGAPARSLVLVGEDDR